VLISFFSADEAKTPWWAGRESNPDLQLRKLPCCSVTR